jgi:hypothetical protein
MSTRRIVLLLSALMSMHVQADGVDDLFDKAAKKRGGVNVQVDSSIYRDNDKGVDQARSAAEEVDAVRSRASSYASEAERKDREKKAGDFEVIKTNRQPAWAWSKLEVEIRCNKGRYAGERQSLHQRSSGSWTALNIAGNEDSMGKAAQRACGI